MFVALMVDGAARLAVVIVGRCVCDVAMMGVVVLVSRDDVFVLLSLVSGKWSRVTFGNRVNRQKLSPVGHTGNFWVKGVG